MEKEAPIVDLSSVVKGVKKALISAKDTERLINDNKQTDAQLCLSHMIGTLENMLDFIDLPDEPMDQDPNFRRNKKKFMGLDL